MVQEGHETISTTSRENLRDNMSYVVVACKTVVWPIFLSRKKFVPYL